jgi:hypothetical protein
VVGLGAVFRVSTPRARNAAGIDVHRAGSGPAPGPGRRERPTLTRAPGSRMLGTHIFSVLRGSPRGSPFVQGAEGEPGASKGGRRGLDVWRGPRGARGWSAGGPSRNSLEPSSSRSITRDTSQRSRPSAARFAGCGTRLTPPAPRRRPCVSLVSRIRPSAPRLPRGRRIPPLAGGRHGKRRNAERDPDQRDTG